jgi:uncharacterized repeat protein (TIGR03803 family)
MNGIVNRLACASVVLGAALVQVLPAQTFTTLYSFCAQNECIDGKSPNAGLVQGSDGVFYGTTQLGGPEIAGTVFRITPSEDPDDMLIPLYVFCLGISPVGASACSDGELPNGLVLATDGNFYGTTLLGGINGFGTVFKMWANSVTLTTLYSFCSQNGCTDGCIPQGLLIQATDGNLYGTTASGGGSGGGTVFRIHFEDTPSGTSGTLTTLYSFCSKSGCTDGSTPTAGLVQAPDGNFYGTTTKGGVYGGGTVFKVTPGGALTRLYSFCSQSGCPDGEMSNGLALATDGNLYGTTTQGGVASLLIHGFSGGGTVFRITPSGTLTTLYSFCSQSGCTDGCTPWAALVQATDGNLYGTASSCGNYKNYPDWGGGTAFRITPSGTLTTLYSFCSQSACTDGLDPQGTLIQATDGNLYGTTTQGGANVFGGTVFSLSGLDPVPPAVNTGGVLNSGSYTTQGVAPGSIVSIFGTNLAAATVAASTIPLPTTLGDIVSVTFNNIPAGLYFVSPKQINAQFPFDLTTLPAVNIEVTRSNNTVSATQSVTVVPASPGIFTTTANGLGQAFAYDNTTGALSAPDGTSIGNFHTEPISLSSQHALIIDSSEEFMGKLRLGQFAK